MGGIETIKVTVETRPSEIKALALPLVPIFPVKVLPTPTTIPIEQRKETPLLLPANVATPEKPEIKPAESWSDKVFKIRDKLIRSRWREVLGDYNRNHREILKVLEPRILGTISSAETLDHYKATIKRTNLEVEIGWLKKFGTDEFVEVEILIELTKEELTKAYSTGNAQALYNYRKQISTMIWNYNDRLDQLSQRFPDIENQKDRIGSLRVLREALALALPTNSPKAKADSYNRALELVRGRSRPYRVALYKEKLGTKSVSLSGQIKLLPLSVPIANGLGL